MSATLAELRQTLNAIEGGGYRRRPALPFGIGAIDAKLAGGGLRLDGLHEVVGATPDLADDAAATLFLTGIAARAWGTVLWIVRRRDLFAPGLSQAGLATERVLYAEAADDAEVLALMEEGLRHRGLGAVIGEVKRVGLPATRRLQLAAEGGRTIALMLKRHGRSGVDPLGVPSAAVTRWRIGCAPSTPLAVEGVGRARWHAALVRQRGGESGEWQLEACDATGRCALPARLVDRPAAAAGYDSRAAA
ncbi:MAG TPA: protein ImuA [Sphingomonas bacterium]|jgi:protein ImuA|uniref:Protein ImuA n=1 Tax=Sphingomonas bacterium TaxID=1895847 RepID=A0A3D0WDL3_9SPHN|nr:protein ImuA [Sphingomonas bacterium]